MSFDLDDFFGTRSARYPSRQQYYQDSEDEEENSPYYYNSNPWANAQKQREAEYKRRLMQKQQLEEQRRLKQQELRKRHLEEQEARKQFALQKQKEFEEAKKKQMEIEEAQRQQRALEHQKRLEQAALIFQKVWRGREERKKKIIPALQNLRQIQTNVSNIERNFQETLGFIQSGLLPPNHTAKQTYQLLLAYDEDLTKKLLLLDNIQSGGSDIIREGRKALVSYISQLLKVIDPIKPSLKKQFEAEQLLKQKQKEEEEEKKKKTTTPKR